MKQNPVSVSYTTNRKDTQGRWFTGGAAEGKHDIHSISCLLHTTLRHAVNCNSVLCQLFSTLCKFCANYNFYTTGVYVPLHLICCSSNAKLRNGVMWCIYIPTCCQNPAQLFITCSTKKQCMMASVIHADGVISYTLAVATTLGTSWGGVSLYILTHILCTTTIKK